MKKRQWQQRRRRRWRKWEGRNFAADEKDANLIISAEMFITAATALCWLNYFGLKGIADI